MTDEAAPKTPKRFNITTITSIVVLVGGIAGILTYLNTNYADAGEFKTHRSQILVSVAALADKTEKIALLELQQASIEKKLDDIRIEADKARVETQLENTEDKIFDLKRQMDKNPSDVTDEDRRKLDKLERRLQRYERRLEAIDALEDNS